MYNKSNMNMEIQNNFEMKYDDYFITSFSQDDFQSKFSTFMLASRKKENEDDDLISCMLSCINDHFT